FPVVGVAQVESRRPFAVEPLTEELVNVDMRRFFFGLCKSVVTADLAKAIEESAHVNVDQFFSQWLYGAGAPRFDLSYTYDGEKHQVMLTVKQIQRVEGRVGLFRVPVEVAITTGSGPKVYNFTVSKDKQTFPLPAES